jgi:UDP-N-acetylglucosamine 1-carboxyvinyltransferase
MLEVEGGWGVEAQDLKSADFYLNDKGVSASCLAAMVAANLPGKSVIRNASTEVEVDDLCMALQSMGANAERDGRTLRISGPLGKRGVHIRVPGDAVWVGTVGAAAVMTNGEVVFDMPADSPRLKATLEAFEATGVRIELTAEGFRLSGRPTRGATITTGMHPAFPADLQPPFTALLASIDASSRVVERHYRERFDHVQGLRQMGASIRVVGDTLEISAPVRADPPAVAGAGIRECAALMLFALTRPLSIRLEHMDSLHRGYANLPDLLNQMGAAIQIPAKP